jgi:hypothetical protein
MRYNAAPFCAEQTPGRGFALTGLSSVVYSMMSSTGACEAGLWWFYVSIPWEVRTSVANQNAQAGIDETDVMQKK